MTINERLCIIETDSGGLYHRNQVDLRKTLEDQGRTEASEQPTKKIAIQTRHEQQQATHLQTIRPNKEETNIP